MKLLSPQAASPFSNPLSRSRNFPNWPPPRMVMMDSSVPAAHDHRRDKEKLIIVLGATGCGKSRLSLDLASVFSNSEIVNADKMQLFAGLDVTTNKIPVADRRGVPHHLLGEFWDIEEDVSPAKFRALAAPRVSDIVFRGNLPVFAGGSNSFIHAVVAERFDPEEPDAFSGSGFVSRELSYDCCFLWVDVALPVLFDYLCKRVDDMLVSGMFEELAGFYDPEKEGIRVGLRKAIGVPELDRYFKRYPPEEYRTRVPAEEGCDRVRREAYEEAVREIKENTCLLAKRQIGKILRLRGAGWDLRRLDATSSFKALQNPEEGWSDTWETQVVEPSAKIVKRFLSE